MGTTGANVISTSSLPSLPVVKETELQISAQDEQSRSSEDLVSSGHSSGDSSGQLFGHSSGQPCDVSSAWCIGTQHSTRTPPLQSAGIPTTPQSAARSARIRMRVLYDNASDRSTSHGNAPVTPVPGRPRIRLPSRRGTPWSISLAARRVSGPVIHGSVHGRNCPATRPLDQGDGGWLAQVTQ